MKLYFLLIRIAAWLGNRKAKALVAGEATALPALREKAESLKGATWIHCASVGEFEQARPLIEHLRRQHPRQKMVLTFFSPSGYNLRCNYDRVDAVFYLPFATRKNAEEWLNLLEPKQAIFVKYEFWPAYLKALKAREISTILISAIFRPDQLFFRWYGGAYLRLLGCFTQLFVQDEASRELLAQYGVENVVVAGDTRFDRVMTVFGQAKEVPQVQGFVDGARRVLVAGSTWPEDEALLAQYVACRPDVRLVLVPHEIDEQHLHRTFQFFEGRYLRFTNARPNLMGTTRVMVVDTIGLLSSIYRYGQVAYVGGGFGDGIHNTIEAAVWGMPVVFGPKSDAFREAKGLVGHDAARRISNYAELEAALDEAFARQEEMGQHAAAYVRSEVGATERILTSALRITNEV